MELTYYAKRILRWWWLILLCTVLAAGGSYLATLRQIPIYQTTATLMVGQVIRQANPTGQDFYTTEQLAQSYAQIAVRQPVLQATIDQLGLGTSWQGLKGRVYASRVAGTQLLSITVNNPSPERAAAIANEIARQLILQSPSSPENRARQERSTFVLSQLNGLESRIERAEARIEELDAELDMTLSASQIQDLQAEIRALEALIKDWQLNYADLLDFLQGGDSANYLTIIEPAQVPTVPVSPNLRTNVLLAAAVGFLLSGGAALVLVYIDDTIKSAEDVSRVMEMPVLGRINRIPGRGYDKKLSVHHGPFSPTVEAYRLVRANLVRTNLRAIGRDRQLKSILISSAGPRDGKSVTSANLAVAMAQSDVRTILVDADMRMPVLHRLFQVPNRQGLSDLLGRPKLEVSDCLKDTGIQNLQIITSGPIPPNSSGMLASKRMVELVQDLGMIADMVVFDSPPVLALADATVLSEHVDAVVMIVRAGRTRGSTAREAVARLNQVGASLLGAVLNQDSRRGTGYYPYYRRRKAGELAQQPEQAGQRRWWQRMPLLK